MGRNRMGRAMIRRTKYCGHYRRFQIKEKILGLLRSLRGRAIELRCGRAPPRLQNVQASAQQSPTLHELLFIPEVSWIRPAQAYFADGRTDRHNDTPGPTEISREWKTTQECLDKMDKGVHQSHDSSPKFLVDLGSKGYRHGNGVLKHKFRVVLGESGTSLVSFQILRPG